MAEPLSELGVVPLLELILQQLRDITTVLERQSSKGARLTFVGSSLTPVELLPRSLSYRHAVIIYNNAATSALFVKYGPLAGPADYTVQIPAGGTHTTPAGYSGDLSGVWASVTAGEGARITEVVA